MASPSLETGPDFRDTLTRVVLDNVDLADLDPAERRLALRQIVLDSDAGAGAPEVIKRLASEIDGFGPLDPLMNDPSVTDIVLNGPTEIWIERGGELSRTDLEVDPDWLMGSIERWVAGSGGRVDVSCPIADARLDDGSRLHVVLPPLAPEGPLVSIRRFPRRAMGLEDLVSTGMMTEAQAKDLTGAVVARKTILISGATGTGKTTLLNALLGCVPDGERVVTIEETRELRPGARHVVSLVARTPNVEGRGAVGLDELVRASLRMRPDRIVVGEVRGSEAAAALVAMSTGHTGSMLTLHANDPDAALRRLVGLALQATEMSEGSVRAAATEAIDMVVQLERDPDRRIIEIRQLP